ncbi:neuronal PAS domain-containing protein 4-like [Phycodurus eques]|uniref:neuronal PAS domain-containing protein 4-like n=1 Tax=Phycodurus eques TaxID=693459 RepID=UPI002ACDBA3A|nr:neuronal PAS domain-containing protein 4-like [Phycodurus eques]
MTIWCNVCKRPVNAPCVSHLVRVDDTRVFCRRKFRSTKGASKARRDHINFEIRNMRALLPIPLEDQERLSYLHSMAAVCTYIRKSVLIQGLPTGEALPCSFPYEAFLQALHGFILVTTVQGRLVYVSENVSEYLGLSMVDVLQGDTIYDMVDCRDIEIIEPILKGHSEKTPSSERSFVCSMHTSKTFKPQHNSCSTLVRGSFQSFPEPCPFSPLGIAGKPLFVALCTPTVDRLRGVELHLCPSFDSMHTLDMSFTWLSDSVLYFLGYSAKEMVGRSWYSLVHPEDLAFTVNHHRCLLQADESLQVQMVLRLQRKDLSWAWSYICANKESQCQPTYICCANFIISETEGKFLQRKMSDDPLRPSSPAESQQTDSYHSRGCKRQRNPNSQSEEACSKARVDCDKYNHYGDSPPPPLEDSPVLFTPPYSPASSSSTVQREELSLVLHTDVHRYADQLLSSPEASPSYYSYPEGSLACHLSPQRSLPSQFTFDQGVFTTFNALSPASPSSPAYDFPACASDARLVPDSLAVSDMSESSGDSALHQDDFSLLEQPQEGSLHQVHHVPQYALHSGLPTPGHSPHSMTSDQYSQMEQTEISILAQQISSLASTFDMCGPLNLLQSVAPTDCLPSSSSSCQWPSHAALPSAVHTKLMNDGVLESLLNDLDMVSKKGSDIPDFSFHQETVRTSQHFDPLGLSPTTPENLPPPDNIALAPFTLQLGCHDQNTELHQLNYSLQSNLQQDGLAEEKLY